MTFNNRGSNWIHLGGNLPSVGHFRVITIREKALYWAGLILLIIGMAGFFILNTGLVNSPGTKNLFKFPESFEFPVGYTRNYAVDQDGRIFCALDIYNRIQMYDKNKKFIRGWDVDSSRNNNSIYIQHQGKIELYTDVENKHYTFNTHGQLLTTQQFQDSEFHSIFDPPLHNPFIWIPTPFYLWLFISPFGPWLLMLCSGLMLARLARGRR